MEIGYGKDKNYSTLGYKVVKDVVGIDVKLKNEFEINIREHGYRISKFGETIEDKDFVEIDSTLKKDKTPKEKHRKRHEELHKYLDELIADFFVHTKKLFSKTPISELMHWSNKQTINPDKK